MILQALAEDCFHFSMKNPKQEGATCGEYTIYKIRFEGGKQLRVPDFT